MEENKDLILTDIEIKNKILNIRGMQVMLDRDLAKLYRVETKNLNKAVKRNIERFPKDFMFQLTKEEFENLKFQIGTSNESANSLRSQIVTLDDESLRFQNGTIKDGRGEHRKYLPFVFTEQGVATLSGVLKSKKAIEVNIAIMRAFIVMRKILNSNNLFIHRLDSIERKQLIYDNNFDKIFNALENNPIENKEGIFYEGQIFDAYVFVCDLIKSANNQIILIDNYIDDTILTLFTKRKPNVNVTIYTKEISNQLKLDLNKFNSQYEPIRIKEIKNIHDRFLIIDNNIYHFGASLKDLGKKLFAFSKLEKQGFKILDKIE